MALVHRWSAIVLAVLVVVAGVFVGLKLEIASDMGVFFPEGRNSVDRLLISQMDRGASSNMVYVQLFADDENNLAQLSKRLAKRWNELPSVRRVYNGEEQLLESDRQLVIDNRYALSDKNFAETFTTQGLRESFEQRLRGLASALASVEKQFLRNDPTGEVLALMRKWSGHGTGGSTPHKHLGVWFSDERDRAFAILEMNTSGLDLDAHEKAVAEIDAVFREVAPDSASYILHGPGALASETRDYIRSDLKWLTLYSLVGVGVLLLLVFSSPILLMLLVVPLVSGVAVAVAVVLLLFGSIHGVTLAFGVTLIGVAIDYPVHVFSHMKSGSDSIRHHVSRIWPTLRLGVVTTIIAYAALAFSELDGLSQLGFFTVSGLLTAAAVTRWILPVIAPNWMRISHRARRLHRIIERVGRNAYRVKPVTVLVVFAALITLVVNQDRLLDTSVDSLSPLPVDRRLDEHVVRNQIGVWTGGKLMVATGPTAQSVLELQEDLETNLNGLVSSSVISGFDMAANFLPSVALQKQRQSQLPTDQELEDRVSEAIEGLPFKSGIFDPFIEDISRYRSHDPVTPDAVFATSIGSRFRSLLFEFDGSWVAPILLHGVSDETQLRNLSAKQADTELVYLNLKGESNRIMASVMDHIAWVLAIGSCTIYLVLLLSFGSWLQPLRVLIPTVASILTVSALTVAFGVSLTLFHLVSLLLVMGLGLDYALFFCRLSEHEDEWGTTYRSIWICCVTTVIVFSVLATSQTPPLHTVGITVAMGAALSFLYGAIWSTAQLALGIRPGANQREISPS